MNANIVEHPDRICNIDETGLQDDFDFGKDIS